VYGRNKLINIYQSVKLHSQKKYVYPNVVTAKDLRMKLANTGGSCQAHFENCRCNMTSMFEPKMVTQVGLALLFVITLEISLESLPIHKIPGNQGSIMD
jgi:hypothetical protein